MSTTIEHFWSLSEEAAFSSLSCSRKGLSTAEAVKRQKQYGLNSFKSRSHTTSIILFFLQFKNPITILLIVAALLSLTLGDFTDAVIILVIIAVSSFLGFWQEKGATNAVEQLLKLVQIRCCILRDGKEAEHPVEQVVPGDIIVFSAGDIIPADSLLLDSRELFIDEAAFTGETYPVEKVADSVPETATLS